MCEFREHVNRAERHTLFVTHIAQVCHEANRAIQLTTGDPAPSPVWDEAPEWQKDSAIEGVRAALNGSTPEKLHELWCQFKVATGWVYGEVKDNVTKTHPCLVPYSELPHEQKLKDRVFQGIVQAYADSIKYGDN